MAAPRRWTVISICSKGAGLLGAEEKQAVMEVLDAQSLFRYYGPNHLGKVEAFEQGLADYLGVPFALGAATAQRRCASAWRPSGSVRETK